MVADNAAHDTSEWEGARMIRGRWTSIGVAAIVCTMGMPGMAVGDDALDRWLERQVAIGTWSADVEQTRKLRALVKPLVASGRVVFAQPQRFRWQLGDPPRTIAVGTPDGLTVAYPRLKQAERYRYDDAINPSLRQVLDLLEVGFPTSAEAFHDRYELIAEEDAGPAWRFVLQPRDEGARRLLERINIESAKDDLRLLATEFEFPDGSVMRNDFSGGKTNDAIDPAIFDIEIGDDWVVVEPLADQSAP